MVGRVSALNLQIKGGGSVSWQGSESVQLDGMCDLLVKSLQECQAPTTVLLHFGMNDLFETTSWAICRLIKESLSFIRYLLPNTRIIWSDILPRAYYYKEENVGVAYRLLARVNRHAHTACCGLTNTYFVKHRHNFYTGDPSFRSLFIWDGTHLSPKGEECLVQNWSDALCFFNEHPAEKGFPPLPSRVTH